ncbi:MAG: zinc ribbon domain-containing protein [Candidatus Thermoplasmatota archaeon]|nr:zinc ribbon domain-containing protein [Candidatus Thermoplasmatota archaeon]MBU4071918.1 zinc ribbon domain-containing protein [Candidatus Thermoplasmatota archaeon]MBU4144209.1 zinc ribbon domain-containing protein [Candidatus Thermoplasmatota archaeon]MBU4591097.1 zinc ribbon domain-containing protein [Candidatus Thermoplasmatota archaeon]
MGQYYQPPPPGYGPQPYGMVPPEAESIKSMMNIAGILALLLGILFLLAGIFLMLFVAIFIGIFPLIMGVIDIIIYMNCKQVNQMVDARQYEQAKSKTLIWMIMGFILGGLLIGIIILIAYLKFDALINATRAQAYAPAPQAYGPAPPPQAQQRLCLGCGQQIPLNFNNCPHCGRQAQPSGPPQQAGARMCLGCGQQIQASYHVCPHCGKQMG